MVVACWGEVRKRHMGWDELHSIGPYLGTYLSAYVSAHVLGGATYLAISHGKLAAAEPAG
ncbi:hypothetical protein LX36DRAFT_657493 [Colletotrichum falcatum]|nr:hypothetical protein LX36DRAFT_657493 [Colletotrichum falcatum]